MPVLKKPLSETLKLREVSPSRLLPSVAEKLRVFANGFVPYRAQSGVEQDTSARDALTSKRKPASLNCAGFRAAFVLLISAFFANAAYASGGFVLPDITDNDSGARGRINVQRPDGALTNTSGCCDHVNLSFDPGFASYGPNAGTTGLAYGMFTNGGSGSRGIAVLLGSEASNIVVSGAPSSNAPAANGRYITATTADAMSATITYHYAGSVYSFTLSKTANSNTLIGSTIQDLGPIPVPAPTVSYLGRQTPATEVTNADTVVFALLFSADVVNVDAADFTVSGGSGATVTDVRQISGLSYQLTVSGGSLDGHNGTVGIGFSGGQDIVSQTGGVAIDTTLPAGSETFTLDNNSPTVALSMTAASPHSGAFPVTVTFSEAVSGFISGDVTLSNGTLSNFAGSGASYSFTVTPAGPGAVTVDVAGNVAQDSAGNNNVAASQLSVTTDSTAPSVALSTTATSPHSGAFPVTVTFSEAVSGFTSGDVTLSNGTLSNFAGSGASYSFTVTPAGPGAVTVDVAANVAQDGAGNDNVAASQLSVTTDSTAPTVALTAAISDFTGSSPFLVSFNFSEEVTGFEVADIVVVNGSASALSGSGATYSATVTPSGNGNVAISVGQNAVHDAAGNPNVESSVLSLENKTAEVTQQAVSQHINSRMSNLIANQPVMTSFMTQSFVNSFNANVTRGFGNVDFQTNAGSNAWVRFKAAWSDIGNEDSRYLHTAVGYHERLSDTFLIGAMVQVDHAHGTAGDTTTSGTGWLVGPYFVSKHRNQPLYLEGSVYVGKSDNEVSPLGTYTDQYASTRLLANTRLTGEIQLPGITWMPNIGLSYAHDKARSYVDSVGNGIAGQTAAFTELSLGANFSKPLDIGRGDFTLTGGLSGRFNSTENLSVEQQRIHENKRARVDLGFRYRSRSGIKTNVNGYYDGLFAPDFSSMGVQAIVELSF
ncbi:MAG: Ig-like domain-containing protein [Amphritea sp.]|nr:Ig-like domain-containing protein [Amphritea sp.]